TWTPPLTQQVDSSFDNVVVLSFQRLDVYQRAIEFLALTTEIAEEVPRGHAERVDQLFRAAEAVVRNIAEGAGRWSEADSSKHYKIARGEAMECASSLDVLKWCLRVFPSAPEFDENGSSNCASARRPIVVPESQLCS